MRLKPILFFLIIGGFATYVAVRQYQQGDGGVLRIGQIAPDFTAKDPSGKEVKLSDYRGKLVFLNFWASWCAPCAQEMPDLEFVSKAFKDRPFQMLTLSVDVNPDDAEKFYKDHHLTMPWLPDPGRTVADKYKVQVYPETFIIDKNGHIIRHYPGPINTQIMGQLNTYIGDQLEGSAWDHTMKSFFDWERQEFAESVQPPFRATQIYKSVYQRWLDDFALITELPKALRTSLAGEWDIKLPPVHRRFVSGDGTRRYLVRLQDDEMAETVFIPEEHRNTICISSQIGCALACTFCLTGQLGLMRHLTPGEIVAQVLIAQRDNLSWDQRDSFNIVMMGMGEPLHNYENVMKALRILHDEHGMNIGPSRITLSTAGLLPGIERLAQESIIPNLAISLTGATNQKRDELMPINRKYPLEELIAAVRRFPLKHRQRITFEYVLLKGVTDSSEDAHHLARLLYGLRAKVNLIPLNEAEELDYSRPSDAAVERFQQILTDHQISAFVRKNRGNDISAACGQLKRKWSEVPVAG